MWIWTSGTWKVWKLLHLQAPPFLTWFWTGCRGFCSSHCSLVDAGNKCEHQSKTVLAVQLIKVTKAILLPLDCISVCVFPYFYMWHALKEKEQKKLCEGRKSLLGIGVGISKEIFFVLCLKLLGFFGGGAAGFVFLIIHKRLSNEE